MPVPVVDSCLHLHLHALAHALQQHLRPPAHDLNGHHGRGQGARAPGHGGEGARVQDQGIWAAREDTEGYRGRKARRKVAHPRPAGGREGASEDFAARAPRPARAHAPAGDVEIVTNDINGADTKDVTKLTPNNEHTITQDALPLSCRQHDATAAIETRRGCAGFRLRSQTLAGEGQARRHQGGRVGVHNLRLLCVYEEQGGELTTCL